MADAVLHPSFPTTHPFRHQCHLPPTSITSPPLSLSALISLSPKTDNMASTNFATALLCLAVVGIMAAGGDTSIADKCAPQFQKVTQCLSFATAKAAAPNKECCQSVTELKDSDPACLCYIIEQVHNGSSAAVKSMGLQESRLLQLPSACKLVNASVTECPKLLNLAPNSPEARIFTSNTSTTIATPVAAPGTSSSNTASSKGEFAGSLTVAAVAMVMATAMAMFSL